MIGTVGLMDISYMEIKMELVKVSISLLWDKLNELSSEHVSDKVSSV